MKGVLFSIEQKEVKRFSKNCNYLHSVFGTLLLNLHLNTSTSNYKPNNMKFIKSAFIFTFIICALITQAGTIDFDGNSIEIDGSFEQLAIHGNESKGKITFTDLLNEASLLSSIDYKIKGSTLKITISGQTHMRIDIPKDVNILCRPLPVIYEGSYIFGRDAHHIHVQNTEGEVEINADGYMVSLLNTSGSISVVSYENISAILPNIANNSIVSLDSYLGDILLRIPHTLDPSIKATAPEGTITIKGKENLFNSKNDSGNQVILHTEGGNQIFVTSILHLPDGPTHPELKDQLIKIYIEDQGKLRMDNESRKELTAMGYGPFIEALDDVFKGHLYTQKHKDELDAIIAKYGFPTEKMVGFQYALGAVRMVIFQSEKSYFEKYRQEFSETFGEKFVEMYERMQK